MKNLIVSVIPFLVAFAIHSQVPDDPLKPLENYIGIWLPSSDVPMANDPKFKHLQVINFEWGAGKKVVKSSTGIYSDDYNIPFSEGTITYNPMSKKIVWIEYQYDGDLLFEGEYITLENGGLQRLYTVYYLVGTNTIPNPEEGGWSRIYRETFTPIAADTIAWKTETFIDNKWIKGASADGFKAVRKIK
jgi:hypothetical protein